MLNHKVICHADGDKCHGCDHYHGKAAVCVYAKEPAMTDLDDLIAFAEKCVKFWPETPAFVGILARLVSLRDAEKELPGPVMACIGWPNEEDKLYVIKRDYDALRAQAVALQAEHDRLLAMLRGVSEGVEQRRKLRGFYVPEDTADLIDAIDKAMTAAMGRAALNELEAKG